MAQIRVRVGPPYPRSYPYGLMDVASVITDPDDHWQTGIEYDSMVCHDSKLWGPWCTGVGSPIVPSARRTISITLTGTQSGDDPDYRYSVAASGSVDSGPTRTVLVNVDTAAGHYTSPVVTGSPATNVITDSDEPVRGVLIVTDVATATSIGVEITQDVDGNIMSPTSPVLMSVDDPGIPDQCEAIEVSVTAQSAKGRSSVRAQVTSGPTPVVIDIGSHRAVIGADPVFVVDGINKGLHRVTVSYEPTWSSYSSWLYIDEDGNGSATLLWSDCPTKDLKSPPWTTVVETPFTIYADVVCQTMSFDDATRSVRDLLDLSGPKAIERRYWWSLINDATVLTGDDGIDPATAIAALEQYLADNYNGGGLIHTSVWGVAHLSSAGLLDSTATGDERLRTWRGTPVVVGSGYSRSGSDNPVDESEWWMAATGEITIRMSSIDIFDVVDKTTNQRIALAEQTVVVSDDCVTPAMVRVTPAGAA